MFPGMGEVRGGSFLSLLASLSSKVKLCELWANDSALFPGSGHFQEKTVPTRDIWLNCSWTGSCGSCGSCLMDASPLWAHPFVPPYLLPNPYHRLHGTSPPHSQPSKFYFIILKCSQFPEGALSSLFHLSKARSPSLPLIFLLGPPPICPQDPAQVPPLGSLPLHPFHSRCPSVHPWVSMLVAPKPCPVVSGQLP